MKAKLEMPRALDKSLGKKEGRGGVENTIASPVAIVLNVPMQ